MKILRVVPFPPQFIGGLSYYCLNITNNLAKRKNVICDYLCPDLYKTNKKVEYPEERIKIMYFPCYSYFAGKNPLVYIFSFLKKHYKEYDIIHAHGYYYFMTLQCALLKKIRDFSFILHLHGGIQTPYNHVSSISENLQLILKEALFDKLIGRFSIKSADNIISVSNKDLEIVRQQYILTKKPNFYIPNGVDTTKFCRNIAIDRKYITLIAIRLSYIKGVDIFIELI